MTNNMEKIPKKYSTQVRFTVPDADTEVFNWIKSQYNLSASLRTLIKQSIADYGYADCTCVSRVEPQSVSQPALPHTQTVRAGVVPQASVPQKTAPTTIQQMQQQEYIMPVPAVPIQAQPIQTPQMQNSINSGNDEAATLESMLLV